MRCWETEYLVVVDAEVPGLPAEGGVTAEAVKPAASAAGPASSDSSVPGASSAAPAASMAAPTASAPTPSSASTTASAAAPASGPSSGPSSAPASAPAPAPASASAPAPPTRVLAAAISAHLYTLPTPSDSPSSILYISKVDSSGYAPSAPITRVLAAGLLAHFLSPTTRPGGARGSVTATLFARSQGQYLFPNSVEGGGKRVLGGLGLCQWWKGVYEDAARLLIAPAPANSTSTTAATPPSPAPVPASEVTLAYLLPSYAADEARGILGAPRRPLPPGLEWAYAPPFRTPLFEPTLKTPSLATLIPSLPDDPKTRFLEELVDSAQGPGADASRSKKEGKEGEGAPLSPKKTRSRKELEAEEDEADRRRAHAALAKVPLSEFWERMGFRQECASGDVTGFFSIAAAPHQAGVASANGATAGSNGKTVGEREEGVDAGRDADDASVAATERTERSDTRDRFEPPRPPHGLSKALVERILTSLLNTDFGNRALAYEGSAGWLASTRALVVDEVGEEGWAGSTATIAAKAAAAAAAPVKRKEEAVTMLQPRKKKRA